MRASGPLARAARRASTRITRSNNAIAAWPRGEGSTNGYSTTSATSDSSSQALGSFASRCRKTVRMSAQQHQGGQAEEGEEAHHVGHGREDDAAGQGRVQAHAL